MPTELTDNGDVIFLARAPGQVADNTSKATGASVNRGARSGNKNFDPGSGRFAKKGGADPRGPVEVDVNPVAVSRSGIPQGVTTDQWEKRMDMVRDAARKLVGANEADVASFLKGKVADLSQINLGQFLIDVRAQQVDDLVDVYDHSMRGRLSQKNGIRMQASKPYAKRLVQDLTDTEIITIVTRLLNKGWKAAAIKKNVIKTINDQERRERLEGMVG